ncbi:hypothetical protein JW935_18995, partial [candidate division KSB1 bacterium]|nr:hypothetical protein [candidate division KSB1 bacterium]
MKTTLNLFFIITVLLCSPIFAKTFQYPANDPVFAITFPDNWTIQTEEELLHASPEDESLYLGAWALQEGDDPEAALEGLDEAISDFIDEVEWGEAEVVEINGIDFLTVDGSGVTDETEVDISVTLFSPDGKTIFIIL